METEPQLKEPTTSELYRLINHHYIDSKEYHGRIDEQMKSVGETARLTYDQTRLTNGRVNNLEMTVYGADKQSGLVRDVKNIRESFIFARGALWLFIGIVTVIPSAIAYVASVYIKESVKKTIADLKIEETIEQHIDETLSNYDIIVE